MCGILGWCNFNANPDLSLLRDASLYIKNRGPDHYGEYTNDQISLVHRRLSIIDLSTNSNQPMIDEKTGNVLIFNGEIYNFEELRNDIIKISNKNIFKSRGDSEVILIGYRIYGLKKLLEKLEGMFVFSIWDEKNKLLHIARDRLGEKPLFYTRDKDGGIIFSSTVKSLISIPNVKENLQIDETSIDQYLSFNYLLFEKTFFKGISLLQPGCYLTFDRLTKDKLEEKAYWKIENCFRNKRYKDLSFKDAKEKFSHLMKNSLKKRVHSDVTIGTYLSGGIDSSIISLNLKNISNQKMLAHNISFNEKKYDETKYAEYISKTVNHDLKIYSMPSPKEISLDFSEIVEAMDQPMADTAFISNFYLSKFSKKYSKVVFTGDGADEMLCGYETYLADVFKKMFEKIPPIMTNSIKKILTFFYKLNPDEKVSFNYKINKFFENLYNDPRETHISWRSIFNENEKQKLSSNYIKEKVFLEKIFEKYKLVEDLNYLDQHMFLDLITWFPNDILYKVDRTTMHHSQEGRMPFLDTNIIEFCCSLPLSYKLNLFNKKYILKDILKQSIGRKNLNRKKSGFNSPIGTWIKKDKIFQELTYSLLTSENLKNYFKKTELERYFDDHLKGYQDNTYKIFTIMVLSQWMINNKLKF